MVFVVLICGRDGEPRLDKETRLEIRERDSLIPSIKFENSLEKTHKSCFPFNSRDSLIQPPSLM